MSFFLKGIFGVVLGLFFSGNLDAALPSLKAQAAVVYDLRSKQWIFEKHPDQKMHPASTVKLLTSMVVLDRLTLDKMLPVPASVASISHYKLNLKVGESYSVRDLIYALLMRSANDVAHVLAVNTSGSEEAFAKAMNKKALSLGVKRSHFRNAHGLPHKKQRTSVRDMALIVERARTYPLIAKALKTKRRPFKRPIRGLVNMKNRNMLLMQGFSPLVLGKTGYTHAAGKCFAGYVSRKSSPFILVVYKSSQRWTDVKKLALWSDHFYDKKIARNRKKLTKEKVILLQTRLHSLGLLKGKVDGVFGAQTEAALLRFQGGAKLKVDGLVGPKTLRKLKV